MSNDRFKKRSYNFKDKDNNSKRKLKFSFDNPTFEPELKQFVLESWNGEKRRSKNYRDGWDIDEHKVNISELASRYTTNLIDGLPEVNVVINRQKYGENILQPPRQKSEIIKFLENVLLGLNLLLWICGVVTIGASIAQFMTNDLDDAYGSLYSGVSLIVVVAVAGTFSYYQEYQSSKIMESFKKMVPQYVTVIRDGKRSQRNSSELVVGDVIEIKYGDKLPADIRLLECSGFKVDNSSITGESDPQKRSTSCTDKDAMGTENLAFFSTSVVSGNAKGLVIKVGHGTLIGRLAKLASSTEKEMSPIAKEMTRIIRLMTSISLFFGVVFYFLGISMGYTYLSCLFFVIGIVVGNVPENLNVTLTIILALAAKKMAKKNCLVKQLHAVETLGSISVICSDKTGTITYGNQMRISHFWFNDTIAEADTSEYIIEPRESYDTKDSGFFHLANVAALCSRAQFKPGQNDVPVLVREAEGDSSEIAILKCMEMQFGNVSHYRQKFPKVFEIPFNSINKYQVSIHQFETGYFLAMKGAPEKILDICTRVFSNGFEYEMDPKRKNEINEGYLRLAGLGERVLGFCDCHLPKEKYPLGFMFDEDHFSISKMDLRFVGLISLIDPPRPAVPEAVLKCRAAGVKVCMITGDSPLTAEAIARSVNIITPESKIVHGVHNRRNSLLVESTNENEDDCSYKSAVITGSELVQMNSNELQCLIKIYEELVFARTSPEQKYEIVKAFQKLGHVVAVTGDGVNDSPALKKADIGIAMGSGTEVSKEVADLILLDDNFASIVDGIEDGRIIFDNLKKLIRYTMADNIAEMYCYWVYIILRVPLPMGTIGMLLSTLGADVFPAVSLAYEKNEGDIMKLKPRDPNTDTLMTLSMLSYSYGQVAVIETVASFFSYIVVFASNGWLPYDLLFCQRSFESSTINDLTDSYGQEWTYDSRMKLEKQAQTAFFLTIVICQFANAICCKTRRVSIFHKGMKNNLMNGALICMICVPSIFIYTPYLNSCVSFVPLGYEAWIASLPGFIYLFVYDELRRLIVRSGYSSWISKEFAA